MRKYSGSKPPRLKLVLHIGSVTILNNTGFTSGLVPCVTVMAVNAQEEADGQRPR